MVAELVAVAEVEMVAAGWRLTATPDRSGPWPGEAFGPPGPLPPLLPPRPLLVGLVVGVVLGFPPILVVALALLARVLVLAGGVGGTLDGGQHDVRGRDQAGEEGGGDEQAPDPAPSAPPGRACRHGPGKIGRHRPVTPAARGGEDPGRVAGRQRTGRGRRGGEDGGHPVRGGPGGRVAGEGLADQLAHGFGDAVEVGPAVEDAVGDRVGRAAAERVPAGGRERDQGTPGEHVGRWTGGLVA